MGRPDEFKPTATLWAPLQVVNVSVDKGLSLAQLVEHALCKRMVMGSVPIGGSVGKCLNRHGSGKGDGRCLGRWASNLKAT